MCTHRGGAAAAEAVAEPIVVPGPFLIVPAKKADEPVATAAAVYSTPEENVLVFPFLGNEVGVGE